MQRTKPTGTALLFEAPTARAKSSGFTGGAANRLSPSYDIGQLARGGPFVAHTVVGADKLFW